MCFFSILVLYYQRLVLSFGFVCMANNEQNITNSFGVSNPEHWNAALRGAQLRKRTRSANLYKMQNFSGIISKNS